MKGSGVHLTIDLQGCARFGPDTEWVADLDYYVDPRRSAHFYKAIRTYFPRLKDGALQPGYSGIRPRLPALASWRATLLFKPMKITDKKVSSLYTGLNLRV